MSDNLEVMRLNERLDEFEVEIAALKAERDTCKRNELTANAREAVMRRRCDRTEKLSRRYGLALHAIKAIIVDDGRKVGELRKAYLEMRKIAREALDEENPHESDLPA